MLTATSRPWSMGSISAAQVGAMASVRSSFARGHADVERSTATRIVRPMWSEEAVEQFLRSQDPWLAPDSIDADATIHFFPTARPDDRARRKWWRAIGPMVMAYLRHLGDL